jgi:hypothetical protein
MLNWVLGDPPMEVAIGVDTSHGHPLLQVLVFKTWINQISIAQRPAVSFLLLDGTYEDGPVTHSVRKAILDWARLVIKWATSLCHFTIDILYDL